MVEMTGETHLLHLPVKKIQTVAIIMVKNLCLEFFTAIELKNIITSFTISKYT